MYFIIYNNTKGRNELTTFKEEETGINHQKAGIDIERDTHKRTYTNSEQIYKNRDKSNCVCMQLMRTW